MLGGIGVKTNFVFIEPLQDIMRCPILPETKLMNL
jgi:hypothetical protein